MNTHTYTITVLVSLRLLIPERLSFPLRLLFCVVAVGQTASMTLKILLLLFSITCAKPDFPEETLHRLTVTQKHLNYVITITSPGRLSFTVQNDESELDTRALPFRVTYYNYKIFY